MSSAVFFFVALVATISVALFAQRWVAQQRKNRDRLPFIQIFTFAIVIIGLATVIVFFPDEWLPVPADREGEGLEWEIKQALLGFLGVVVSAAIAISASSLLGNAFAGFMIRSIPSIKTGSFVRVNEYFGKISERGLLHLEMETDTGELITLPNMYVTSHPLEVLPSREERRSVQVQVAIGYAVHRSKVARLLKEAAERAGLKYPMVFIKDLGNCAVTYESRGFLPRKSETLTMVARSKFLAMILDVFHENKIEVLSPEIGVSREISESNLIPERPPKFSPPKQEGPSPAELLFEKAKKAENKEQLEDRLQELKDMIKAVKTELDHVYEPERREHLTARMERLREFRTKLEEQIKEED